MKLLIIGKNGQVGSALVKLAQSQHIHFVATDRTTLDITQEKTVHDFFQHTHDFDFVINAAGYTQVDTAEKEIDAAQAANQNAAEYLATACNHYHIPFIHISTDYVFDGKKAIPYKENDATQPKNQYGLSKLNGEIAVTQHCPKHIILRVSWIFSETGKNFVKTISTLCEQKETLSVVCDQFGSPTSARSIADVILKICMQLHHNKNNEDYWGTYHYTDFPATNWHQFACYIARQKNHKIIREIIPIESKDYPTIAERPKNSILNTQKIKTQFGIDQTLWTTEVERIVQLLEEK